MFLIHFYLIWKISQLRTNSLPQKRHEVKRNCQLQCATLKSKSISLFQTLQSHLPVVNIPKTLVTTNWMSSGDKTNIMSSESHEIVSEDTRF